MSTIIEFVSETWSECYDSGWAWFAALNREEWLVVLAVGCLLGFLCMRGFGSRSNY
ncbi:MAG: hypothetical protein AAGJ46_20075 [Planctomycetota bacterium]